MNVGILGTGSIARKMTDTISAMDNVKVHAVASRTIENARRFAEENNISKFYGSYEQLAKDSDIDLIYIATPHSRHYEDAVLCIENGKNILCEKAFTANASQAKEIFRLAEEKGVFVTEAIWTRFMPMRFTLDRIISSNVIGNISSLTANLGYSIAHKERIMKPELAGGALLDLGVYTINFALMAFRCRIKRMISSCTKNQYGVDIHNSIIAEFEDGKTAILHNNAASNTDRMGVIYGDKGRIEVTNINNCEGIRVILNDGTVTEYETPKQISGYEYEVYASMEALEKGERQCSQMPHEETVYVMEIMDSLRKEWGIKYPFE